MPRAPLLIPAVFLLAGVIAEQHRAAAVAIAGGACLLLAATLGARRAPRAAAAAGVALGVVLSALRGHPPALEREAPTARYAATVIGDVRPTGDGRFSTVLLLPGIGAVRTSVGAPVQPGERVIVRGRLEPFDLPRNPGEPSLRAIERVEGLVGRLAAAQLLARAPPDWRDARTWPARVRAAAARIVRARIPEPSATILAGALWGERGALPDDLHAAFQATGTVHILVTAGLHLGVIAGLALAALRLLGVPRAWACGSAFVLAVAYAWVTGGHLPTQRAATMIGVALLARASGARAVTWNALAIAAAVVAALAPAAVESASFALSFSCVAAIVLFAEPVADALERLHVPLRIREPVALTVAAQLGTWPLTAAIFSTLAPYALLANALVVPLTALALTGGLAALAIPLLAIPETAVLRTIEACVRGVAALPGARATIPPPPPAAIAFYDIAALAAGMLWRSGRIRSALLPFALGCAVVLVGATPPRLAAFEITFLDVGQADAAIIRTPAGHVVVIDAGGMLERGAGATSPAEVAGERIVLGYLRRAGIARVDLLILSHPHGDHVGGCAPIVGALRVDAIVDARQPYGGRAYSDCMLAARAHRIRIITARAGMHWSSGDGAAIDILAPADPFLAATGDDVNENSIVALLRYVHDGREFRALFMGDAGEASEARLLTAGADLHADVVKVGHHGSRYASTPAFVAAVAPRIAVISVGRHNTFGHPGPHTLATLADAGAAIYRTDECGAVTLNAGNGAATTMFPCGARALRE